MCIFVHTFLMMDTPTYYQQDYLLGALTLFVMKLINPVYAAPRKSDFNQVAYKNIASNSSGGTLTHLLLTASYHTFRNRQCFNFQKLSNHASYPIDSNFLGYQERKDVLAVAIVFRFLISPVSFNIYRMLKMRNFKQNVMLKFQPH